MRSSAILLAWLAAAQAVPQNYNYVPPPKETYIPPPSDASTLINSVENGLYTQPDRVQPSLSQQQPSFTQQQQPSFTQQQPSFTQQVVEPQSLYVPPERQPQQNVIDVQPQPQVVEPQSLYIPPERQPQPQPQVVQPQPLYVPPQRQPQPQPQPSGSGAQVPTRFLSVEESPSGQRVNQNPGSGSSGPLGVFVGACAASMVCVPEAMCNPYTGFVRGGLLFEPRGPSAQPTVALLRCYRLKDGGVGDGVCCQMPHINDPWPDQQG